MIYRCKTFLLVTNGVIDALAVVHEHDGRQIAICEGRFSAGDACIDRSCPAWSAWRMQAARLFIQHVIRFVIVVLTNFLWAWMLFGCSPAAVHIVSADAAAFQQWLHDGMASDARRPAHLMEAYVRGRLPNKADILHDERWPEPYTATVGPSIRPGEYHLAYAAQRLLREHYAATHPQYRALERNELAEIIEEAGGNLYVHEDFAADRVVDLVDVQGRSVFEIVPPGQAWQAAGKEKIDWLLRLINYGMIGVPEFQVSTATKKTCT